MGRWLQPALLLLHLPSTSASPASARFMRPPWLFGDAPPPGHGLPFPPVERMYSAQHHAVQAAASAAKGLSTDATPMLLAQGMKEEIAKSAARAMAKEAAAAQSTRPRSLAEMMAENALDY